MSSLQGVKGSQGFIIPNKWDPLIQQVHKKFRNLNIACYKYSQEVLFPLQTLKSPNGTYEGNLTIASTLKRSTTITCFDIMNSSNILDTTQNMHF